jgi:glycosyltransferase involved in cell wall biosynthesis
MNENKKAKILFVHHDGSFGGAPKSLSQIIERTLLDKRLNVSLLNIANGPINDFFIRKGFKVEINKRIRPFHGSTVVETSIKLFLRNWIFLIPSIFFAFKEIKKRKPDLIHLNSTCLLAFSIASFLCNVKVICHVREPVRNGIWGLPLRFFNKLFVDGFIAISDFDLSSIRVKSLPKSVVIYNSVDSFNKEIYKSDKIKKQLKLDNQAIVCLYLARFSVSNGWQELIGVFNQIKESKPNYHLVLAGTKKKEHLNLGDSNIHILPFQEDVNSLLTGSDMFICPFIQPHFARGIIEASSMGLPVIGSDVGGVNELIKHGVTGLIYKDKDDLIKSIDILGTNEELRRNFGLAGVAHGQKEFDIVKNNKRIVDFLLSYLDFND